MRYLKFLVVGFLLFSIISCGENNPVVHNNSDTLSAVGEENTLEITTWNIENFPKDGNTTINKVENIIRDLDVDIFAIQEIADTNAFRQVLMDLPGYNGLYSEDTYSDGSYQKTGIIYKKNIIEVASHCQLFCDWDDWYAFPRPPLLLGIKAEKDGNLFDFNLIIIHLKAGSGWEEIDRRRAAACSLKNYIDEKVAIEEEKDYIVAGDWNDEIDDTEQENSFNVFIADSTNYKFLTWPLAGKQYYASWPHYPYYSLIDHILISKDCFDEFDNGSIETLRLDDDIINYFQIISDHRPVMAKFPVF